MTKTDMLSLEKIPLRIFIFMRYFRLDRYVAERGYRLILMIYMTYMRLMKMTDSPQNGVVHG